MQLLFTTRNHWIPLAIVTNKTLSQGDIVEIKDKKYYINLVPGYEKWNGKKVKFYFCVRVVDTAEVTNTVQKSNII